MSKIILAILILLAPVWSMADDMPAMVIEGDTMPHLTVEVDNYEEYTTVDNVDINGFNIAFTTEDFIQVSIGEHTFRIYKNGKVTKKTWSELSSDYKGNYTWWPSSEILLTH